MLNKKHVALCFSSSCLVVTLWMHAYICNRRRDLLQFLQQHSRHAAGFRNITTLETSFVTGLAPIVMLLHAR